MRPPIRRLLKELRPPGKVLECGSLNVNGSISDLFHDYIGVDMRFGKNVDVVANSQALPFDSELFDVVLSLDTLEHDNAFWESVFEMRRVLKTGGLFVITVPGRRFPLHRHPYDYWRFMADGIECLLFGMHNIVLGEHNNKRFLYGYAKK